MMSELKVLNEWADKASHFFAPKSAQGYLQPAMAAAGSCGTSCGADGGKPAEEPKPSACGAGDDKPAERPKEESKPSACGSACGAGDQK
jgi:ACGX-repeat protein